MMKYTNCKISKMNILIILIHSVFCVTKGVQVPAAWSDIENAFFTMPAPAEPSSTAPVINGYNGWIPLASPNQFENFDFHPKPTLKKHQIALDNYANRYAKKAAEDGKMDAAYKLHLIKAGKLPPPQLQAQAQFETGRTVPTKPTYVGEGFWAKQGNILVNKPYTHQALVAPSNLQYQEKRPDGYDIFQNLEQLFVKQKHGLSLGQGTDQRVRAVQDHPLPLNHKPTYVPIGPAKPTPSNLVFNPFTEAQIKEQKTPNFNIRPPRPVKIQEQTTQVYDNRQPQENANSEPEENEDEDEDEESADEESSEEEFTPVRLYTQVRRTEDENHVPPDPNDHRLKKVVKDSKVQTVYSEEGYEDSAYDHEGEERHAENIEDKSKHEKEVVSKRPLSSSKEDESEEVDDEESDDSDSEGSDVVLMSKKEIKTTSVKNNETLTSGIAESDDISSNKTKSYKFAKKYPKVSKKIDDKSKKNESSRVKRFTNDFPNFKIDTDFIDKINHTLPIEEVSEDESSKKYPYYERTDINEHSPLRYAEDLKKVPLKIAGELSFYRQAENKLECEDIPSNIDAIPKHVINSKEIAEESDDETAKELAPQAETPKLRNLGDKIDCFKLRYFGENPLDNPLFKEEFVEPVKSIFPELSKSQTAKPGESQSLGKDQVKAQKLKLQVEDEQRVKASKINEPKPIVPILIKNKDSSMQETQSNEVNNNQNLVDSNTHPPTFLIKIADEKLTKSDFNLITTPNYSSDITPENIYDQIYLLDHLDYFVEDDLNLRQGKVLVDETLPKPEAIRRRLRRPIRRRRLPAHMRPLNKAHSINNYRYATTEQSLIMSTTESVKPKILSEVYYKDEIKPNEQLAVFKDVLNTIRNSPKEDQVDVTQNGKTRVKKFQDNDISNVNTFDETVIPNLNLNSKGFKRKHFHPVSTTQNAVEISSTEPTEIAGLVPPENWKYNTINVDKEFSSTTSTSTTTKKPENTKSIKRKIMPMNNYLVFGMKPPPNKKPLIYSDFIVSRRHSRYRRSPNRPSYAQFSRNQDQLEQTTQTTKEDDDDYVPHRPKNYYYDEKTGKIVYLKQQTKPESAEEEEEVEYIEVTEETPAPEKKEKVTTKPLLATATPPPAGQSYIDFVVKLKNSEQYKYIPDPTTTEKGETTTSASKEETKPTAAPEFLNILAKVKTDGSYKVIKDPEEEKKTKSKSRTTTIAPIIEEEEEDTENDETIAVQNSPGGQSILDDNAKLQIFDIGDFLPKIRNYSPKTSIDYSKYKTIERPSVRHNLSSRYNSDTMESLDEVVTVRKPLVPEEQSHGEELVSVPISTTTTEGNLSTTNRRRRPISTRRPTGGEIDKATQSVAATEVIENKEEMSPQHERARRVYRKRPIRIRSTTVQYLENEEDTPKVLRKRAGVEDKLDTVERSVTEEKPDDEDDEIGKGQEIKIMMNESVNQQNTTKVVEVFKEYDESQKHGGNYKKENDTVSEESNKNNQNNQITEEKKRRRRKRIRLVPASNEDNEDVELLNKPRRRLRKRPVFVANNDRQPVQRLSDIVPKPDVYYTDPRLPKDINQLRDARVNSEEVKAVVNDLNPVESEENANTEIKPVNIIKSTTKKPIFIKDPSKRLYYYAPI